MDFYGNVQNDDEFWKKIILLFSECGYNWVADLLEQKNLGAHSDDLAVLYYLWSAHEMEKKEGKFPTVIDKCATLEDCRRRYMSLKFYLRRIEYDLMDDMMPFYEFIAHGRVSMQEIMEVMNCCVFPAHIDKVGRYIQDAYQGDIFNGR